MPRGFKIDPRFRCRSCGSCKVRSATLNGIVTKTCVDCGHATAINIDAVKARNKRVADARRRYNMTSPPMRNRVE